MIQRQRIADEIELNFRGDNRVDSYYFSDFGTSELPFPPLPPTPSPRRARGSPTALFGRVFKADEFHTCANKALCLAQPRRCRLPTQNLKLKQQLFQRATVRVRAHFEHTPKWAVQSSPSPGGARGLGGVGEMDVR